MIAFISHHYILAGLYLLASLMSMVLMSVVSYELPYAIVCLNTGRKLSFLINLFFTTLFIITLALLWWAYWFFVWYRYGSIADYLENSSEY
jgi:hypothetical protein